MTLHEAIRKVLVDSKKPLTSSEIAMIINEQELYIRNDKRPIPSSQISARINRYLGTFTIDPDGKISVLSVAVNDLQEKNKILFSRLRNVGFSNPIIIPVLYFFKRVIDNPDHYKNLQIDSISEYNCKSEDFLRFLNSLNSGSTCFRSFFELLIKEVESNFSKSLFHDLFPEIDNIDLRESSVSNESFNEFFISILASNLTDARGRGEYYTPLEITEIVSALSSFSKGRLIYNPFAGQCSMAISVLKRNFIDFRFYGEEINRETYLRGLINLTLNNIDTTDFLNTDSFSQMHPQKADLCISYPPLISFMSPVSSRIAANEFINSRNSVLHSIHLIIDNLNHNGRAIIVVAENFLFSNNNDHKAFRKKLLSNNLIESIISLPADFNKPFSNVKSNLLVINKSKASRAIIFWDYGKFTQVISQLGKSDLNPIAEFTSFYSNIIENISLPKLNPIDQIFINVLEIEEDANNLVVSRYLREKGEELDDPTIIRLGDVLQFVSTSRVSLTSEHKLINISDLNRNYFNYKIDISNIETKSGIKNGHLISENSILVGCISGSFKPSYFEYNGTPAVINPNIYALSLKEAFRGQIDTEFLIYELSSDYVLKQVDNLAAGVTSLKRISKDDLLNIRIKVPSLQEQRMILKNKKDALLAARISDTDEFARTLDITTLSEKKILEFVNHELGNIKGAIINDLDNLKNLIVKKSEKNEVLFLDTKITTRSVGEIFTGLVSKFDNISSIMETIQNILQSTKESMDLEPVRIKEFIEQQVETLSNISKEFHIVYSGEELFEAKDYVINIDKKQFALVIRNFIINSYKHGYNDDNQTWKNLVFDVSEDNDYFYIDMVNDGKPFSEEFSFDDFIAFGKRGDARKGSGLGGHLINKIIENHGGKFELLKPESLMAIPNPPDSENDQRMIFPGVHFRITLPKTDQL